MHSVDLLEEALQIAMSSGYEVRQEWMDERGGGECRIGHRRILFVDLSLSAREQLEVVLAALRKSPQLRLLPTTSPELKHLLTPSDATN
ncbi:MAG: hypothetical protein D6753_13555 [Planctomycetota bacterium]|nr:MAG: hypothetical protein D6753_13555 [Planctomycetota bacterium]